jgi:hypothetical protein
MPQEATPTDLADEEEVKEVEEAENLEGPLEFERPEALLREAPARSRERDRFYRLLNGPLKDAVAAICADFGLKPDWSQWTENGFPPPPGGHVRDWGIFLAPESHTAPPPERDDDGTDSGDIVWRPIWRQPRRRKPRAHLDPRYDPGPATWPDFNDDYFNEVLKKGRRRALT